MSSGRDESHFQQSSAQLVHARELLGSDSIHMSSSSFRRMDQVSEFVHLYTQKSLRPEWKGKSKKIARTIMEVSLKYGFDPMLVLAVIDNESGFRPEIVGRHGEIGLMQIKPDTAEWIAKKAQLRWKGALTLRDPSANIRIGAAYLAMLRTKFDAKKDLYLAAYNMGVSNLNRALKTNTTPVIYARKTIGHYSRIYTEFLNKGEKAASVARTYASI